MKYARNKQATLNKEKSPAPQQELLAERSTPISAKPAATNEMADISALVERCRSEIQMYRRGEPSDDTCGLELLYRAIHQVDEDAWVGLRECLSDVVLGWFYIHPSRRSACRLENNTTYVDLTFERFWQATLQRQVQFETFASALVYLRACLNGAVMDTLRTHLRAREVSLPESGEAEEPCWEDNPESSDVWLTLQAMLPDPREQRLAYLLYHCGLKPREIMKFCPQEWSDIQEIYRLRRNIVDRLRRNADQLRWRLNCGDSV